jgi:hypothetical protein
MLGLIGVDQRQRRTQGARRRRSADVAMGAHGRAALLKLVRDSLKA